jgi:hypothetical protein
LISVRFAQRPAQRSVNALGFGLKMQRFPMVPHVQAMAAVM